MQVNIEYIINHSEEIWSKLKPKNCPECKSEEFYHLADGRLKCKHCGKIISSTSGTLLHHSHLPKWKWIYAIWKISNSKGISNIELAKDIQVNVKTAWLMQQKIRFVMGDEWFKLEDLIQMDEAYVGGWSKMHFNKKMDYMRKNHFVTSKAKEYTKTEILAAVSHKKHHIVGMVTGNGTKLLSVPNPINTSLIRQILKKNAKDVNLLVTDESKLYKPLSGFELESSNHSKHTFMTSGGHSSNGVENRFSWVKRKWNGIYTHTSRKYLQLYLNQMAWTVSRKKKSKEAKFEELLLLCAHARVKTKDIINFNAYSQYKYEDVYLKEWEQLQAISKLPFFKSITTKSITTKHGLKI